SQSAREIDAIRLMSNSALSFVSTRLSTEQNSFLGIIDSRNGCGIVMRPVATVDLHPGRELPRNLKLPAPPRQMQLRAACSAPESQIESLCPLRAGCRSSSRKAGRREP